MNIRLFFKVYSRRFSRVIGLLTIFILISLLVISPLSISYAERRVRTQELLDRLGYHGFISFQPTKSENFTSIMDKLIGKAAEYGGIEKIVVLGVVEDVEGGALNRSYQVFLNVLSTNDLQGFLKIVGGRSNVTLSSISDGEMLISTNFNFTIGDRIYLVSVDGERIQFNVSGYIKNIMIEPGEISLPFSPAIGPISIYNVDAIITPSDLDRLSDGSIDQILIYLIFSTDYIGIDLNEGISKVNSILNDFNRFIGSEIGGDITSSRNNLLSLNVALSMLDLVFITMTVFNSIPYFFGIWYLTYINLDLVIREYRRDIGILILRGIPNKSVRRGFLIYLIFIAFIGSLLGFIISPFIGNLIITRLGYDILPYNYFYTPDMFMSAFIVATIILIISYWRRVKLLRSLTPLEASREFYEPLERETWSPSTTFIIFFILSCIKIGEWLISFNVQELLHPNNPFFLVGIIYSVISGFMQYFAPIIFIYGVVNLIVYRTKFIPKISKIVSSLISKGFKDISFRYSGRLPGLISKTTFLSSLLISLMLYYMLFSSRTLYFFDSYLTGSEYFENAYVLSFSNIGLDEIGELVTYLENILGSRDVIILPTIESFSYIGGTKYYLNLVPVDNISLLLDWLSISDWMLINVDKPYSESIIASRYVKQSFESNMSGSFNDIDIDIYVEALSFPKVKVENIGRIEVDGYLIKDITPFSSNFIIIPMDRLNDFKNSSLQYLNIYILSKDPVALENIIPEVRNDWNLLSSSEAFTSSSFGIFFQNILVIMEKSLYPFHIFAIFGVVLAILISSIEYVKDMVRDMAIFRARGMGRASLRFIYSLVIPTSILSIVLGVIVGFIAGYGASQQTIIGFLQESINFPIVFDQLSVIYLGIIIIFSLVIPYLSILYINRRVASEVMKIG